MSETDRMLRDIALETVITRSATGRSRLDDRVLQAMRAVPRHHFVPPALRRDAYSNGPLPIGAGQTISQPFMVALMTDLLDPQPDDRVLEIGTGSGYQAAILARLVGQVYSLERLPELSRAAAARLDSLGYANVTCGCGDGYAGWPEHAPYDGILVTAAAPAVPPALLEQLGEGASLVIPVGPSIGPQALLRAWREPDGRPRFEHLLSVAFVPLLPAADRFAPNP